MVLATAILWGGATGIVVADPARSVLVLFSNSRITPGNVDFDRGLRAAVRDASPPVHLFYEFLDSPEFSGDAHERTVIAYVRNKYATRPPDAILAVSDAAFEFLARHRDALFPDARIVYGSVSPTVLGRHALARDSVGVPVQYDFAGTIEVALRWHPNAQRLVIVTGTSSRDRGWEARLREEAPQLAGERGVEYWSGLPTTQLLERLARLDSHAVVFTPGYYADGDGTLSNPGESAARIARASAAPVYGPLDTFIGTGIVGGRMARFEDVGRRTGTIATRILAGATPESLASVASAPVALHVDWRQVERFGIRHEDIPGDAIVHHRAPTFWQQYRGTAIAAATVILLQAALIAALLIERRRRRSAELVVQRNRVELAHASRLAVAGELTASIAHEINQPLGAVQTSADAADLLLQSDAFVRDDLRRIVTRIRRDIVRASDVIRRLRTLLARHAPEQLPFALGRAIEDVVGLMSNEARRRGVTLDARLGAAEVRVLGDETQIQQVLMNLVLNAMDAVAAFAPERRVVGVATELLDERVRVTVHDRGNGIAADEAARIFDSFYTTKPNGMGLGLSIARSIVEAHHGRIFVHSEVGVGATLCFELPVFRDAATPQGAP